MKEESQEDSKDGQEKREDRQESRQERIIVVCVQEERRRIPGRRKAPRNQRCLCPRQRRRKGRR